MKMIKSEIMTENVSIETTSLIEILTSKYFPAFSIQEQTGYWHGRPEKSLLIVIISSKSKRHLVYTVADKI